MATSTLTSTYKTRTKLSQTLNYKENTSEFHDASFSSYITNAKSLATQKVVESKRHTFNTGTDFNSCKINSERKMADGEISIFGAEKYFNGGMDEVNVAVTEKSGEKRHFMKDEDADIHSTKLKFKPGARSTHSESSWNSRSKFIPLRLEDQSPSQRKKVNGKSVFSTFSWKCSCSDKKSVDIDKTVGKIINPRYREKNLINGKESIQPPLHITVDPVSSNIPVQTGITVTMPCQNYDIISPGPQKDESFTFTVSKSVLPNLTAEKQCEDELEEKKARKSLEVFGSPSLHKVEKTLSLDRKLNMFSWDVNPFIEDIPENSSSSGIQDDEGSDSSSDLFEIANFSEDIHPFFERQASAGMSAYATTTCYEPSEASFDWSVVTASAVNFPTVSNHEEQVSKTTIAHTKTTTTTPTNTADPKTAPKKEVQRSHPNGFLGCKSHSAARVAEEVYRVPEKSKTNSEGCHKTKTLIGSQIETESRNLKRANARHASLACSLPRLYSGQASKSLYMH